MHLRAIKDLMKRTCIFPSPDDLLICDSKLQTHQYISAAAKSLGYDQPPITLAEPSNDLVNRITGGSLEAVLKREFSMASEHVITKHTEAKSALRKLATMEKQDSTTWGAQIIFRRPRWFLQPYIPDLIHRGEVRAFVFGGHLLNSIITTPVDGNTSCIKNQQAFIFRPLAKLDR